jgi:hypothetical protein
MLHNDRIIARNVALGANGDQLVTFGPFANGERLARLHIYSQIGVDGTQPASLPLVMVELSVHKAEPPLTEAAFDEGLALTDDPENYFTDRKSVLVPQPSLVSGGIVQPSYMMIPLMMTADADLRYLACHFVNESGAAKDWLITVCLEYGEPWK